MSLLLNSSAFEMDDYQDGVDDDVYTPWENIILYPNENVQPAESKRFPRFINIGTMKDTRSKPKFQKILDKLRFGHLG